MRIRALGVASVAFTSICIVATGCSSASPEVVPDGSIAVLDDDGDDVELMSRNEPAALTDGESDDDDETPADYVGAESAESRVSDLDVTDNDDETEEMEPLDVESAVPPFPKELLPGKNQAAIPSKIKYVVVIIKENHSFDNYFTGFPGASWSKRAKLSATDTECRPLAPAGAVGAPCHSNCCAQYAYDHGDMDHFRQGAGMEAACNLKTSAHSLYPFIRYTENEIPNYWKIAKENVLADHFFSTTMGPSSPGHEVFWFAQSTSIDNAKCTGGTCSGDGCWAKGETIHAMNPLTCTTQKVKPCFNLPSLPEHLPSGFTWTDYGGKMASQIKWVSEQPKHMDHFRPASALPKDIAAGNLASLTIAHISGGPDSEHPPEAPCKGENFTVQVLKELMALPTWKETAVVITWDDWGGFYDHVKPSVHVCKNNHDKVFENGFRLPLILVSPYAKKGFVLKDHVEQASVPRLVEQLWGMKPLSTWNKHARDGVAGSLMPAFDFKQKPRAPFSLTPRASCPVDTNSPPPLHIPQPVHGKCPG